MSKHRGKRIDANIIDEVIPEEIKEEVSEIIEELVEEPVAEPEYELTVKKGKVTAFSLYVRENPSTKAKPILAIGQNTEVEILSETDEWLHVLLNDGTKGYCMSKFIEVIN